VSRSHQKFKIELNSNQFANYKKRFGNRKGISNFYLAVGRNLAGNRAQPGQPLLFPSPSSIPAGPSGLHGAQPSRLPLSRLQPSSRLPPFLFTQPIVQPSRRPERKSIPGRTPRGETRYRVHTRTVFINPSSSPFQIRCDPTRFLQIGDRTEIVSASATSRWISPYK
jgi:hypothetical protein